MSSSRTTGSTSTCRARAKRRAMRVYAKRLLNRLPPYALEPERIEGGWRYRETNSRLLLPSVAIVIGAVGVAVVMARYSVFMAGVLGVAALCAGVIAGRARSRRLHVMEDGTAVIETPGVFGV